MAQQLNLNDPRFAPQRQAWTAVHGLAATALVLVATGGIAQAMLWLAARAEADTRLVEAGMGSLRGQVAAVAARPGDANGELVQLKVVEAAQRRVRAALDAGVVGNREGHAGTLSALARQSTGTVWITGLQVSDDGQALVLEGRMANANALGDYLRRLEAEPRFKGRPFSQLQVRLVPPLPGGTEPPISEFQLRSQAGSALAAASAPAGGRAAATAWARLDTPPAGASP